MSLYPSIDTTAEADVRERFTALCKQIEATNARIEKLTSELAARQKARDALLDTAAVGSAVAPDAHGAAEAGIREIEAALVRERAIAGRQQEMRDALDGKWQPARAAGHRARVVTALREYRDAHVARHAALTAASAAAHRETVARGVISEAIGAGWPLPTPWQTPLGGNFMGLKIPDSMSEQEIRRVWGAELAGEALGPVATAEAA